VGHASVRIGRGAGLVDVQAYFHERIPLVNRVLDDAVPRTDEAPQKLHAAMRHILFPGGKRLRPVLAIAAAEAVGGSPESALPAAAAVELVHTYSLIHDDLPAMDNDDLRRGKPTVHRQFDEATAILAADALQPLAFSVVASISGASAEVRTKLVALIADACGSIGMTGGQSIDLASEGESLSVEELEKMYALKTGALIHASVMSACLLAESLSQEKIDALDSFARDIGVAFQIKDDILDVEGETHVIGKPAGSDVSLDKATYPALFGIDVSRARCDELLDSGVERPVVFGDAAEPLRWLARYIVERRS